jgi:hypothetical protein
MWKNALERSSYSERNQEIQLHIWKAAFLNGKRSAAIFSGTALINLFLS